jgi:hypothetical protein
MEYKEICLEITKNLSLSNYEKTIEKVIELKNKIKNSDEQEEITLLFETIAFPIFLIFEKYLMIKKLKRTALPIKLIEESLKFFEVLFLKVNKIKDSLKILNFYQNVIYNFTSQEKEDYSNEEVQIDILKSFDVFLQNHFDFEILNKNQAKGMIAMFTGTILEISEKEKSRELKTLSIQTLTTLFKKVNNPNILTEIFPGVSMKLTKFILGDYKLGKKFIIRSLECFGVISNYVCSDEQNKEMLILEKEEEYSIERLQNISKKEIKSEKYEMFLKLRRNFGSIVKKVFNVGNYETYSIEIKIEILKVSSSLISNCKNVLLNEIPNLLEIIMMGINEFNLIEQFKNLKLTDNITLNNEINTEIENEEIKNQINETMLNFIKEYKNISKLNNLMIDRFEKIYLNLIEMVTTENDKNKIKGNFILINSYLEIFNESISFQTKMDEFLLLLFTSLEMDSEGMVKNIQKIVMVKDESLEFSENYPKRYYKYINDDIYKIITQICFNLGKFGDIYFYFDYFLNLLNEKILYKHQVITILSNIVFGSIQKESNKNSELLGRLIDEVYIEHLKNETDSILISIILENLSKLCIILKEDFPLMTSLFILLEKLSSNSEIISQSSFITLKIISKEFDSNSISDLLYKNYDYILDDICNRMKYLELYKETPLVVKSLFNLIKNSNLQLNMILLMEDSIQSVFDCLDDNYSKSFVLLESFFSILDNIVLIILKNKINIKLSDYIEDDVDDEDDENEINLQEDIKKDQKILKKENKSKLK